MAGTAKLTSGSTMMDRLDVGLDFMRPMARRTARNCGRYLGSERLRESFRDGSNRQRRDVAVGEVNYLAINLRQKVAQTAIGVPDYIIETYDGNSDDAELVRLDLRKQMDRINIARTGRRCLLMQGIGAASFVRYFWDGDGFGVEYVSQDDLSVDPHVTDETWDNLRWAFVRVKLPAREAMDRYPARKLGLALQSPAEFEENNKDGVEVWCGWDATTEVEISDKDAAERNGAADSERLLDKRPNLYECVPVIPLLGDHDPESEFSLGDYDTALGASEMLRRMQNILTSQARNGGGVPWVRAEYTDEEQLEQYVNGELEAPMKVTGAPGEDVFGFTPNQSLNPATMEMLSYVGSGLDADQAVTQYDRGVTNNPAKFATEANLLASRSTSRGTQKRIDYERFLRAIAKACVKLNAKFGLDPRQGQPSQQEVALFKAYQNVRDVKVIEESASFKDPVTEQQASMQLLTTAASLFEITLQTGKPLDIWAFIDDTLRAFNRRDLDKYRLADAEAQQLMQQMAQQAQAQGGKTQAPKTPSESLNYKDAPPDIQRQIEAQAGLQPSQMGQSAEQLHQTGLQQMKGDQALEQTVIKAHADQISQAHDHIHAEREGLANQAHDTQMVESAQEHAMTQQAGQQGHQTRVAQSQQQHQMDTQQVQQQGQERIAQMSAKAAAAKASQQKGAK